MGTISKNFDYKEFEKTDVPGMQVRNTITSTEVRDSIKALVDEVLQPLRDAWDKPLAINSGYRCPEVNKAVGGVPTSQHTKGEAADVCPFGRNGHGDIETVRQLAITARDLGLPFDQMILYPSFVHFSHRLKGEQRRQILYNKRYAGKKL
jgi:hypothetical protein